MRMYSFLLFVCIVILNYEAGVAGASVCDVTKYGAVGNNITEDTASIQAAIDACKSNPGTVVFPPPGKYMSRALNVSASSGLTLDIQSGATLVAWPNIDTWNASTGAVRPFIWGEGPVWMTNLTLTGGGVIDGQGWRWWPYLKSRPRPVLLSLMNVTGLHLYNLTLKDSPSWHTNLRGSFVHVHDMTLLSNVESCAGWNYAPNTDGFNIGGHDFYIHDNYVHNGDDCVPVFAYGGADSYNILVERMECHCGTNGGVVILGDDTCGGAHASIHNVTFRDMLVNGTNQGAGMKICEAYMVPHGIIHDVTWSNISITNPRYTPLYIDVYAEDAATSCSIPAPVNRSDWLTAANLTFQDIRAEVTPGTRAGCFLCTPGQPCTGIVFDNVTIVNSDGTDPVPYTCANVQAVAEDGSSPAPCGQASGPVA